MEPVRPEEIRRTIEKIANKYQIHGREREILMFTIGYYGIDYPNKEDVKA